MTQLVKAGVCFHRYPKIIRVTSSRHAGGRTYHISRWVVTVVVVRSPRVVALTKKQKVSERKVC